MDIVEKLRALHPYTGMTSAVELEAADEIVRLQTEIGRLRTALRVNGYRWGFSDIQINKIINDTE